jgi:uncharacterized protein (DUF488 family)
VAADVFTIGYSGRSFAEFLGLLRENAIAVIADVRSQPFSKFNADFNQDALKRDLTRARIHYVFLGAELGARTSDESCYVEGKVQYDRLAATAPFQAGLDRVSKGRATHRLALMCAESDPLMCHRCILVSRHLRARGVPVRHILENGLVEEHEATMRRLMQRLRISEMYPSWTGEQMLALAYETQGSQIAYRKESDDALQFELWGQSSAG